EDLLILCEHEPVVTLGKNAPLSGLRVSEEELARRGVALHRVERGGEATFHGPGQVVGYPVLKLRDHGIGVKEYVLRLEEVMIRAAAGFGVAAGRRPGTPGVFTEGGKLGAVGVAVRAGVTFHGFAFNAAPDLSFYSLIIPCGMADVAPVSIESLTGCAPSLAAVRSELASAFEQVF
ncbi:MAG TPA: lipoyl(octanoyl) transferase LipB, partial [Verrucomicrobiae bacterium]